MTILFWGLGWLLLACASGLVIGRSLRLADERDAARRATRARHPSALRK